jgi:uncharacterized protein (DUF58 family)
MPTRPPPPEAPRRAHEAAEPALPGRVSPHEAERLLSQLEWTVLRRLDGLLEGDYRTLLRGMGLDLADLREYQTHDDVRYIDWNVTARMNTPYVREFQQDRELSAWFLLDLSGSVDFGAAQVSKRDVVIAFVAVMARLLTRRGNQVGCIVYGDRVDTIIPAGSGRAHVLQMLHRLMARPSARGDPAKAARRGARPLKGAKGAAPGETHLDALLTRAGALMRRRCAVFVVSDFISAPGWTQPLGWLAQRHDVLAVRVVDPLERALPDLGIVTLQDAETGQQQLVDTHDRAFRHRFEEAVARHDEQLAVAFSDAGVDVIEMATDDDLVDALWRFLNLRKLRLRVASGGGAVAAAARS